MTDWKPPTETSATVAPNFNYGYYLERSSDPWHADAFPQGMKHAGTTGERKEGWMIIDWAENPVGFVPDGTPLEKANKAEDFSKIIVVPAQ